MTWLLAVSAFVMFIGLVVLHELGHFIVARRNGVEAEEFGIGFPPTAWRKRIKSPKGDYDFTLNWLPLGGFVRLKGEHDADTEKGSFGAAKLKTKVKIILAGVIINAVTAFAMLTLLAAIGIPKVIENQFTVSSDTKVVKSEVVVTSLEDNAPAKNAGLKEQDVIVAFTAKDGTRYELGAAQKLPEITKQLAGQEIVIDYKRSGTTSQASTTVRSVEEVEASKKDGQNQKGYLGIVPAEFSVQRSTWSSPIVAAGLMKQVTEATFKGLGTAIAGLAQGDTEKASSQVSGIVGIGYILTKGSLLGIQFILFVIALISLTLAIMNVLPIPALDGGRLFVTLLFRAIKKPLTPTMEEWIHGSGFAFLMILFVLITIVDVKRFF